MDKVILLYGANKAMKDTLARLTTCVIGGSRQRGGVPVPQDKPNTKELITVMQKLVADFDKLSTRIGDLRENVQRQKQQFDNFKQQQQQKVVLADAPRPMNILDLPPDVILKIFENANVVLSRLCKYAHTISKEGASKPFLQLVQDIISSKYQIFAQYTDDSTSLIHSFSMDNSLQTLFTYDASNASGQNPYGTLILRTESIHDERQLNSIQLISNIIIRDIAPMVSVAKFRNDDRYNFLTCFIQKHRKNKKFHIELRRGIVKERDVDASYEYWDGLESYDLILKAAVETMDMDEATLDEKYNLDQYREENTAMWVKNGGQSTTITYKGVTRKVYARGRTRQVRFNNQWMCIADFKKGVNKR